MKRFIYSSVSALVLATAAIASASATPLSATRYDSFRMNQMELKFTAPFISSSALLGDHHVIRVMVIGMSLEDLTIRIPPQMAQYDRVSVTDESGEEVPAKITASKEQVAIVFNQPVESGHILKVDIGGVRTEQEQGYLLLYGVTGKRVGTNGQIPIGTARIQVPSRG